MHSITIETDRPGNIMIPERIKEIIGDRPYVIDSIGCSGAAVVKYDDAILKIEKHRDSFQRDTEMMKWLKDKRLPVPEVLTAFTMDDTDYLLMTKIEGKMACDEYYMENADLMISLLAEALKMLWSVDISDCPYERASDRELEEAKYRVENGLVDMNNVQPDTFGENGFESPEKLLEWLYANRPLEEPVLSHGDFCLPNLFLKEDKISGFIDLGGAGIRDKWMDIADCWRSLKNNADGTYGGKVYEDIAPDSLFEKLGMEPDWEKIRYWILLDELFR